MRAQPVDSLSEREYQVFREREAACLEIQRARAGADEEGQRAVPPGAVQPWMIQARVEPGSAPGEMDIVVRNESDYRECGPLGPTLGAGGSGGSITRVSGLLGNRTS